ncbi:MAG: BNR/Asp-box repeat protein [Bacteroidota bacterium]|jgi:hypothetical protein|nr:BNR/Asp-box repeat protein [Bacteroidota bacterium]
MKKQLLFGFAAFAALAATAQNSHKVLTNPSVKKMVTSKQVTINEPINKKSKVSNTNNNKVAGAPYKRIGGSTNAYGVQSTEGRAITYNEAINTLGMVIRKQAGWTGVTGGNSGTIAYTYSQNSGTSWDSTIVVASSTKLMRHPGGTIYNPVGNTTPSNAYAVVSGPWHPGASWQGDYFASKQLSFPGSNTSGSALFVDNLALSGGQKKRDFSRCDMQATSDGKVRVLGGLYGDINSTTVAGQAFRGAMINTGTFNAGSFTWTVDSLKPNFKLDGAGDPQNFSQYNMAWSEDGQIGYVVFVGVDANAAAGTNANTFSPYVFKTTNGGASWSRHAPLFDFSTIPSVGDRVFSTWDNLVKPWVSAGEGTSATVDANGNLHFLATFTSGASDHIDSLGYTFNIDFANTWNYVTDFHTTSTGWCAIVLDSLKSEGPDAANSPWTSVDGGVGYDARLQVSRTTNGQKIFYSWTDSDQAITGTTYNSLPNIYMKAYDLNTNMVTDTKDMTSGKVGPAYASYWMLTSPIVMNPSAGNWLVPAIYTGSDDASMDGDVAVSYYYIDDNAFTSADFSMALTGNCPPVVTGIKQQSTAFENLNFYPNPTSSNGTIEVVLNENAKMDIAVINSVGQTVYSTTLSGNAGSNKVELNLTDLSSGLYFYQVKLEGSKAITKKFAVEK